MITGHLVEAITVIPATERRRSLTTPAALRPSTSGAQVRGTDCRPPLVADSRHQREQAVPIDDLRTRLIVPDTEVEDA